MGKKSTFSRELPEKSTRGQNDFKPGIYLTFCGETLCKNTEIIEAFLRDNHGYGKILSLQMWKTPTFSRELPEKSTRGHTDFLYGTEPSLCGKTSCKRREIRFPRYSWIWESIFLANGKKIDF
jgi:hypothetical protein